MNIIKGLIVKDLLQLKSYKKTLIVFVVVFIGASISQEHTRNALIVMMTLGLGMFGMATFSYDEMAKADKYIITLPLNKKEVVLAKYVLIISLTVMGAILGIIVSIILSLVMQTDLPKGKELLELAIGGIFGIGVIEAIQIPFIYKYGAEKGRIQIFIAIAMIAFLLGGIVWLGEKFSIDLLTNPIVNSFMNAISIVLIVAIIMIYFISYKISYKIYEKKEM